MDTDAEAARSILACAAEIEIAVEGEPLVTDEAIGLQDWSGTPTFVCPPDSALAVAGRHGSQVSLSVSSALDDEDALILAGSLRHLTVDSCDCCDSDRALVAVDLSHVLLMRPRTCTPIDVQTFCDPLLQLNAGYLRRTERHINGAHDDHLRAAIARLTDRPVRAIAAAQVARLAPTGLELQWVTEEGAHAAPLSFARAARSADELGWFLRYALHPELC